MPRYALAVTRISLFSFLMMVLGLLLPQSAPAYGQQGAPQARPNAPQQKQIKTLAVVNGEEISRQQIATECMRRFGEETLENIVNTFLVAQECERMGIMITEKDVNDHIAAKAKAVGMSTEKFLFTICSNRDTTPDRVKNDVFWKELALKRLAAKQIEVTPEEINKRMEYEFGPRVQVRQIVCDSLQKATQIQQAVAANPNEFERMAKQHSLHKPSASVGGLMMPIRRNSDLPELEKAAFSMQKGQVSGVIPLADSFVILRCERFFEAEKVPEDQLAYAHERIIEAISNDKLGRAAIELFDRLQKQTKIVNVMNDPVQSKQMPGVAALVNNRQILINKVAEDCITRFGKKMLDTEINRMLLLQAMRQRGVQVGKADINAEIKRAASTVGYVSPDGTVNMDQWLAYVTGNDRDKVDFYIEDEIWPTVALKKLVEKSVTVTQEDLQKGFEANFAPRVEALAIMLFDNRSAQKVWRMATANPKASYFGQLANEYSMEPTTKNNFGEIPPIPMHGGQPALEREAFRLKPGEISQVIQVGENFLILFCKGRTEPVVSDMDAVKDELYADIMEKKLRIAMMEEFQQLRQSAQIDNFLTGTSQPGKAAVRAERQAMRGGAAQPTRR